MISRPRSGPAVAQSEEDGVVRVRQGRGGRERGGSKILGHFPCFPPSLETLLQLLHSFFCTTIMQTGSMSCPGRCGALCGYSSNGCGRPNHQGAQPNHHHHHSGKEGKILISPPGPFAGQGGVFQGVAVESWVQCSITTGGVVPTFQSPDELFSSSG